MNSTRRGFTLIELLVAMGVVAILVSILLPAVSSARKTARKSATMSLIRDLKTSLDHYGGDFGTFPNDGNLALKNALEESEYRSFSSKELSAGKIVDGFRRHIGYDEIERTGFDAGGGDGVGDPRGSAKNRDYDIWSLGADGLAGTMDDVTNWRK